MAIGSLISGISILAGAGGKGGVKERKQIIALWNALEQSNFDFHQLSFPELQMVQQLLPEVYTAIVPDEVKQVIESPEARTAQLEALGQTQEIARGGLPLADRIAAERAQGSIQQASRGRDLAVLRSLASRGGLGSGDEAQLRLQANASTNNLGRDLGQSLQETALNRRLSAIGQYGEQAGALRQGDFRAGAFNAEAVNRFNEQVANSQNRAAEFNAAARAGASRYNVGTKQRLSEQTALGRLDLRQQQQRREDALKGTLFNQQATKIGGQSAGLEGLAAYKDRDRAAKEQAIAGIGGGVDDILGSVIGGGGGGLLGGGGGQKAAPAQQQVPQGDYYTRLNRLYGLRPEDMYGY